MLRGSGLSSRCLLLGTGGAFATCSHGAAGPVHSASTVGQGLDAPLEPLGQFFISAPQGLLHESIRKAAANASCSGHAEWDLARNDAEKLGVADKSHVERMFDLMNLYEIPGGSLPDAHPCLLGLVYAGTLTVKPAGLLPPEEIVSRMQQVLTVGKLFCFDLTPYSGWPVVSWNLTVAAMEDEAEMAARDLPPAYFPEESALQRVTSTFQSVCGVFDQPPLGVECLKGSAWPALRGQVPAARRAEAGGPRIVRALATGTHAPYISDLSAFWRRFLPPEIRVEVANHAYDPTRCLLLPDCEPHAVFEFMWERLYVDNNINRCDGRATAGFENVELVAHSMLSMIEADPDLAGVEVFVCAHPAISCRLFMPLVERGRSLIGYIGGTIEIGVPMEGVYNWMENLVWMAAHPKVALVTQNTFLAEKIHYRTGVLLPAVRPFGAHITAGFNPTKPHEVLIWKTAGDCVLNQDEMLAVLRALVPLHLGPAGASAVPELRFRTLREDADARRGYEEVAAFRAVVMFPYDITVLSFYELYHMRMPLFLPTPTHALMYAWRGADVLWRGVGACASLLEGHRPLHILPPDDLYHSPLRLRQWIRFADWYRWPGVFTFASLHGLVHRLLSADGDALRAASEEMRRFDEESLVRAAHFWARVFNALLKPDADDVFSSTQS